MLVMEVHVGVPTTKRVFEMLCNTVCTLLEYSLQGKVGCCVEDLSNRIEWAVSAALQILEHQPIARCYKSRFGMARLMRLVRRAELYVLASLIRHYAQATHCDEDTFLEHMLKREQDQECPKRVYH